MAPPSPNNLHSYHFCFLLLVSTSTVSAALTASSYSALCPSLKPASDSHTEDDDVLSLTRSFQISSGYFSGGFSGGADSLFSTGDDLYNRIYRSFSVFPHGASRTSDPALAHLTATLTIKGPRGEPYRGGRRSHNYTIGRSRSRSISFFLDGYYSSASLQLCMVGTGTELAADGSLKLYKDIALRLHVPSPPTLTDPFVTGTLEGHDDLGIIHLLAYAEGDDYKYKSEGVVCGTPKQQARGSLQALGVNSSAWCAHLKEQLVTSYRLQEHDGASLLRQMHINQVRCAADDDTVRAYVGFSNDTGPERHGYYYRRGRRFVVDEEAVVAEGRWDRDRGVLCLRACRVVRSPLAPSVLAVREHECGIRMSFWFPAVWTMRSRSLVAGKLWNSTGNNDVTELMSGAITVSSIDDSDNHRSSNLSDVKYSYNDTMLEEAKKHYRLKIETEKIKESHSFPGNYTYRDFVLDFYQQQGDGHGQAFPVTLGSAMVSGDRLAADDSFSQLVEAEQDPLLSVSYDIHHNAPPDNWVRPSNVLNYSVHLQERRILAEGVYDPKRGLLFMIGCRERNLSSTDCQILVTVQFASLEARGQGHGKGVFSSLREKTDPLFFEKIDITLYGMYSDQVSAAISRMDLESIMLVASTTLSCVFAVLQILHTKKNPEAAAGTSITMLAILTLGYLTPLVLNFEAMFKSRSRYFAYPMGGSLEMNEAMLRAPILVAFVLQLRLLQLAWSGRQRSADQTTPSSPVIVSERIVLQICLPLYLLGGILAATIHVINAHAGSEDQQVVRLVRVGEEPTTIWDWEDLVSYAGLILDGFLLPQVILNASLAASRVRALSPWFYIGCTMTRVMPHVYDVVRAKIYEPSINPSDIYASPRSDLFGVAWDIVIPCGAALLAMLVFLQQRLGGTASLPSQRRSGGYELVATL
ncbi:uncharacterized protein LOC124660668 [Lolium rigidum]|uniref:uncharacterized protein LOC124660668 n=1 Tax=Lolium rigidum TaxID=89674 RepID=UPI001F5DFCCC|nr:uncharacterized protein LOC124660668 [Lolium rigidum]